MVTGMRLISIRSFLVVLYSFKIFFCPKSDLFLTHICICSMCECYCQILSSAWSLENLYLACCISQQDDSQLRIKYFKSEKRTKEKKKTRCQYSTPRRRLTWQRSGAAPWRWTRPLSGSSARTARAATCGPAPWRTCPGRRRRRTLGSLAPPAATPRAPPTSSTAVSSRCRVWTCTARWPSCPAACARCLPSACTWPSRPRLDLLKSRETRNDLQNNKSLTHKHHQVKRRFYLNYQMSQPKVMTWTTDTQMGMRVKKVRVGIWQYSKWIEVFTTKQKKF